MTPVGKCQHRSMTRLPASRSKALVSLGPRPGRPLISAKSGLRTSGLTEVPRVGMTAPGVRPISYLQSRKESMSEASSDVRRKKLRWRSWHRGTREMDLLVGGFADAHLDKMSEEQLERFEQLLDMPDPDLYRWLVGREAPPAAVDHDILHMMRSFKFTPRSG